MKVETDYKPLENIPKIYFNETPLRLELLLANALLINVVCDNCMLTNIDNKM